jgi:hypothetical protein
MTLHDFTALPPHITPELKRSGLRLSIKVSREQLAYRREQFVLAALAGSDYTQSHAVGVRNLEQHIERLVLELDALTARTTSPATPTPDPEGPTA